MRIVDPHVHLWDLATGLYPGVTAPSRGFIGDKSAIARSYLPQDFLAETEGGLDIAGAVHVEAFPTDPVREVAHVQAMADATSIPLGIVGRVDLSDPHVEQRLGRLATFPAIRGVRQVLNTHKNPHFAYVERDYLADDHWRKAFGYLEAYGLSFDLQIYPHQGAAAAELAAAYPRIAIVLNHAGMWVDRDAAGWRGWKAALSRLAAQSNIVCKISGLGMFDHNWTVESFRPLILETIEAFGPDRCMFASNFPVDRLYGSYASLWAAFSTITEGFGKAERDALFFGTAARIYRLTEEKLRA